MVGGRILCGGIARLRDYILLPDARSDSVLRSRRLELAETGAGYDSSDTLPDRAERLGRLCRASLGLVVHGDPLSSATAVESLSMRWDASVWESERVDSDAVLHPGVDPRPRDGTQRRAHPSCRVRVCRRICDWAPAGVFNPGCDRERRGFSGEFMVLPETRRRAFRLRFRRIYPVDRRAPMPVWRARTPFCCCAGL